MQEIIERVMQSISRSGLVEIETSARHVHLTSETVKKLFGEGKALTERRPLSQPGQFLCEQRVTLIGAKGKKENVAVLGPERGAIQVELSKSDCIALGVAAPYRESGDIKGSGSMTIVGPCGQIEIDEGVIIAKNHIHTPPEMAKALRLSDKQLVSVEALTGRPVVFKNVVIRVSDKFSFRMHVDFDEANASDCTGFTLGKIIA